MKQAWGEYLPDLAPHGVEGLVTCDGVYPTGNGYAPFRSFEAAPEGDLGSTCLGATSYRALGEVWTFAADATDIHLYDTTGYTSINTGMTSSAASGVRFAAYANYMLVTNGFDAIQLFDPSSPAATADLDASAPTAKYIGVVKGFVIAAYADDVAQRIQWSGNGDPAEWTSGTLESGVYDLNNGGGDITGFVGGDYGLIVQETKIIRMDYSADDAVWQYTEIATDIGCIAPWSLASYGKLLFFLSNKGLMACDGTTVQAIGDEKVSRTFLALTDLAYIDNMSAVVDPKSSLYVVSIPSASPPSSVLVYHYGLQKFTTAPITATRLFSALGQDISLDALDAIYGNLDAVQISLDSPALRGGYPLLMLFDGSNTLGSLAGEMMEASFLDVRRELIPGRRARVTSIRPIDDAAAGSVSVGAASSLADLPAPTIFSTRTSGGFYRTRVSGSFIQVGRQIPAGTAWTFAQGFDVEAMEGARA